MFILNTDWRIRNWKLINYFYKSKHQKTKRNDEDENWRMMKTVHLLGSSLIPCRILLRKPNFEIRG